MANISRDTFDKLKHYVGVRLQQGVPLVDADWNEQEDIRKFELQSFLKWFVGNGVPKGNDGFRIMPIAGGGVGTIVLTSNKGEIGFSSIVVNMNASTSANVLGFDDNNYSTSRTGSSPARLTGNATGPFNLTNGSTLVVSADGQDEKEVVFNQSDFNDISQATSAEVVNVINNAVQKFTASVGEGNDFIIKGGTPDVPGRCLVEGWDVIIEQDIKYTEQPLYENDALAEQWGVNPLVPLRPPSLGTRGDTVYLDVWEREVDAKEDDDLINTTIGIETCVRMKREWVVRVAVNLPNKDNLINHLNTEGLFQKDHAYYPLATLIRKGSMDAVNAIIDRRRTILNIESLDKSLNSSGTLREGTVGNAQVKPNAAIDESKILFSINGHNHSGGNQGQSIDKDGLKDGAVILDKIKFKLVNAGSVADIFPNSFKEVEVESGIAFKHDIYMPTISIDELEGPGVAQITRELIFRKFPGEQTYNVYLRITNLPGSTEKVDVIWTVYTFAKE